MITTTESMLCIAAIIGKRMILMPEPEGMANLYDLLSGLDVETTFKGNLLGWPVSMEFRLDRFSSSSSQETS